MICTEIFLPSVDKMQLYKESYVHGGDPKDIISRTGSYRANISPRSKTAMGNRYSVVSDASSNTTSGIASDKMTVSFEENDGESILFLEVFVVDEQFKKFHSIKVVHL